MSDDFLTLLRERLSGLLVERSKIDEAKLSLDEKFETLMADARRDGRSDLNVDEVAALEAMKAERKALDDRRAQLEKDITEAEQREADIVRTRHDAAEAADKIKRFNIAPLSTSKNGVRGSDHSLDELLWAGADSVRAGRLTTDTADFIANPYGARNSVERVTVRNGEGQVVRSPGITDFPERRAVEIRKFQMLVADMQLFGMMVDKRTNSGAEGFMVAREHPAFRDEWKKQLRAMDTDTSNEGVDWIPTGIGSSLHERVRASGKVRPLFQTINLPTNPWKWPLEGADATAYRAVKRVLDRVESESATEYRAVMAARYEQLWRDARSSLDALPADHAGRAALLTSARGVLDSLARLHGITAAEVTVVTPEVRARDRIDDRDPGGRGGQLLASVFDVTAPGAWSARNPPRLWPPAPEGIDAVERARYVRLRQARKLSLAGLSDRLAADVFAAHPVVVRIGGQYFVRSIAKVNEDESLTFFCAIDEEIGRAHV